MDLDFSKLNPNQSPFLKNTRFLLNNNANNSNNSGNGAAIGSNVGKITNILSNELAGVLALPEGTNKTIGAYEFQDLNEGYWFVWNSNGDHTVNVHDGNTGLLKTVYKWNCAEDGFSIKPEHSIPEHRCYVRIRYKVQTDANEVISNKVILEKELIFTNAKNDIFQINVLASIGSNSFTTPYYAPVFPHYELRCDLIALAVVAPLYSPQWTLIDRIEELGADGLGTGHAVDKDLPNKLFNHALQLSYQFVYTDARPSSVSMYSKTMIVGGTDCSEGNPETQPRCASVNFWVGNAHVEKINIFVRENPNGNWTLYDTIKKFDCDDVDSYWERDIDTQWSDYGYDVATNTITYTFCNNKQCTPVDQALFTHIENEVPFASQALCPAGDALLLADNLRDSDNLPCEVIDKFSLTVEPQADDSCAITKRKIEVYILIRNQTTDKHGNGNEIQFFYGDSSKGSNTSIDGKFYFGGTGYRDKPCDLGHSLKVAIDNFWKDYQQYVPDTVNGSTGGLYCGLRGTNFTAVTKQVKFNLTECKEESLGIIYPDITKINNSSGSLDSVVKALYNGEYIILQKATFEDIPSGKYVFEVYGHRTGDTNGFERTSTYIRGSENLTLPCSVANDYPDSQPATRNMFEWTIDVCNDGYNSLQDKNGAFVMNLWDLTLPNTENTSCNSLEYNLVSEIYVYEDSAFSIPCEMQSLSYTEGTVKDQLLGTIYSWDNVPIMLVPPFGLIKPIDLYGRSQTLVYTDHNGFVFQVESFFRARTVMNPSILDFTAVFGEPNLGTLKINYIDECNVKQTDSFIVGKSKVSPAVTIASNKGYKGLKGTIQKSLGIDKTICDRVLIKGRLVDQQNKPLVGITVGYTQSQFVRTDGFGGFKVYAHFPADSSTRCDNLIISNSGAACQIVCIGCVTCCDLLYQNICLPSCQNCEKMEIDTGILTFQKVSTPDKGLRGRYGVGVEGWDYYGRIVTGGVNLIDYMNVPQCWSKHPIIHVTWSGVLPKEIKWLTFSNTANLYGTVLDWVADKFQLLDSDGNVTTNKGNAQAVAVQMPSLLGYNNAHNFNTLSTYGFVKGDILKIIDDCENPIQYLISGTTFGVADKTALETTVTVSNSAGSATSKTNFATDNGSTIIIPYDNQIDDLLTKCAIKIEIVRPYKCENNLNPFGEQGQSIAVIDGVPTLTATTIDAFDIFKIYRNIGKIKDCAQNPNDDPYFSNNVTDFWGANVTSWGRVLSENPYAERKWKGKEIAESRLWINNGVINGLATFWGENTKNYEGSDDIISIRVDGKLLFAITTLSWLTASYASPFLRVTENGQILVPASERLGEEQLKVGMNYGCKFEHTNTIIYYEGLVYWFDSNNSNLIVCDYRSATDVALEGIKGWLMSKNKYVIDYNRLVEDSLIIEVQAGYDPMHNEYHLTFRRRDVGDFDNDNREVFIEESETIVFNTSMKKWVNFRGYTPEYFSKLRNAKSGSQFVSFKNGQPYLHNNQTGTRNTFYGNTQTSVISISVNANESKEKIFQSVAQEILPNNFFIDQIVTSEKNSFSYVPQNYWTRKENTFYAEILRDMGSYFDANFMHVTTFIEGKRMFGKYAVIRFVMVNSKQDTYFEMGKIWVLLTGSELSEKPQIDGK